ncbi:putative 3-hydroxybutyryl-CoA dehydrogenase [Bordetella bronchiseptica RB630]|nr:putative 3-hydroxybutyryl-CoA dehydrogenase [Bordetella bronchiseptica RB630]
MDNPIQNLAVVGAGAMGSGIAALFASKGFDVVLIDPMEGALTRAAQVIERQLGVYAPDAIAPAMQRIRMDAGLEAACSAQLVIEAVPEKLALKRDIFARLDTLCDPQAIFATNTSGLSINDIAQAVTRRDRFVGTHFFTPADVIPLVEVVRNDDTSEQTVARVMGMLRAGGKRPVLVRKDIPGFIANRIQHALAREAISLLEKGVASAEDIDEVVKWSLGIRLALSGPLEQRDMNGIDVHYARQLSLPGSRKPHHAVRTAREQGAGRRTGRQERPGLLCLAARAPRARAARQERRAGRTGRLAREQKAGLTATSPQPCRPSSGAYPRGDRPPTPRKRNALPRNM